MNYLLAALLAVATGLATAGGIPAHCTGCSFAGLDLHRADLANAEYAGVNFTRANLRGADMRGTRLAGVDFRSADLRGANFTQAKLAGVDLAQAQLSGAFFTGATLAGVNLRGVFNGLSDVDARGLLHQCAGCDAQGAEIAGFDLSGSRSSAAISAKLARNAYAFPAPISRAWTSCKPICVAPTSATPSSARATATIQASIASS